jgi:hypothetical protein
MTRNAKIDTTRDVLDWLKYAQSETDGVKLDLASLLAAVDDAELARSRPGGVGAGEASQRDAEVEAARVLREE